MKELKRFKMLQSQKQRLSALLEKVEKKLSKSELELYYLITSLGLETVSDSDLVFTPQIDYKVNYSSETEEDFFAALALYKMDGIIKKTIHHSTLKKLYKDIKDDEAYVNILGKLQVYKKPTVKTKKVR